MDIWGCLFSQNGTRINSEFRVSTNTTNIQSQPSVAVFNTNDDFIVAWADRRTGDRDIWGKIFDQNCDSIAS